MFYLLFAVLLLLITFAIIIVLCSDTKPRKGWTPDALWYAATINEYPNRRDNDKTM